MNLSRFRTLLAVAALGTATAADAAVHRVFPGQSIQAAVDAAGPGDTILVEPGTYYGTDATYGLRITQDNLRLIGKVKQGQGDAGKVRIVYVPGSAQKTGVYAAPAGCDYNVSADSALGQACDARKLHGFHIRGFSVEGFPVNGIQTRWVDGFEITVSNNVQVTQNTIYDNTLGIGLFHPNGAGNPPKPVMANWVIEQNDVRDNNRPNQAVPGTFQSALPPGIGILAAGVSDHVIAKNTVEDNDFVGIAVLGWCTANDGTPNNCGANPPIADPAANNNRVSQNKLRRNGASPPPIPIAFLAADVTYFEFEGSSGNCFEKNKPDGFTFISSEPDGQLPTDGCR